MRFPQRSKSFCSSLLTCRRNWVLKFSIINSGWSISTKSTTCLASNMNHTATKRKPESEMGCYTSRKFWACTKSLAVLWKTYSWMSLSTTPRYRIYLLLRFDQVSQQQLPLPLQNVCTNDKNHICWQLGSTPTLSSNLHPIQKDGSSQWSFKAGFATQWRCWLWPHFSSPDRKESTHTFQLLGEAVRVSSVWPHETCSTQDGTARGTSTRLILQGLLLKRKLLG